MALVAGNHDSQRTFATVERLAVATVGQQNDAVAEGGIELRDGEEHASGALATRPTAMFGPFKSLPSGDPAFCRICAIDTPEYST